MFHRNQALTLSYLFLGNKDEDWRAAGFATSENEEEKKFNSVPLKAELCIKWLFYFLGVFLISEKECLFLVAVYSILIKIKKKKKGLTFQLC